MRKLYNEFFYIPKHGKVREKVMLSRLASTITIVIMCLAAMSFTAYAYFSYNVTSGSNMIKSASFKTEVQVQITDADGKAVDTVKPITTNYKLYKIADLQVGQWYTVTVKPIQTDTSAKTGFVIVTATGCREAYHTQQLGVDENVPGKETKEIKFQLMITDVTDVVLEACWGTTSYYPEFENKDEKLYITYKDGQVEKIKMVINGFTEPNLPKNNETNDITTTPPISTTPPVTETDPPATETTTPPASATAPPETMEKSEPTSMTEPATDEMTDPTETTESTETTETKPAEETIESANTSAVP